MIPFHQYQRYKLAELIVNKLKLKIENIKFSRLGQMNTEI